MQPVVVRVPVELAALVSWLPLELRVLGAGLLPCGFVAWAADVIANASTTAMHNSNFFIIFSFSNSEVVLNESGSLLIALSLLTGYEPGSDSNLLPREELLAEA